jgi:hypothetical protein
MSSNARTAFIGLMGSVDELIEIHGRLQSGQGRRHRQEALHRAGVVLIVAAWQAYIEKLANEALDKIEASILAVQTPPVAAWVKSSFYFRKPSVKKSIGDLNTPNTQNVVRLLDWSFGLDPRPFWIWIAGGRNWTSTEFCDKTDAWLRIRHTIAHGNALPTNLPWLRNSSGTARLNLALLREAKRHFEKLVELTDLAMARHLRTQYSVKTRWYRKTAS